MNYKKIHDSIVAKAKSENRKKGGCVIYEEHHIVMRSLGGSNDLENLVLLTPREHFIVHVLLWKMNRIKIFRDPILFFKHKGSINSRLYHQARVDHTIEMRLNNPSLSLSNDVRERKRAKLEDYARNRPDSHNKKISRSKIGQQSRLGVVLAEDSREKISSSLKEYFKKNEISESTRRKISEANSGRKHSSEALMKMKNAALSRPKWKCPLCNKTGLDSGNFTLHVKGKHGLTKEESNSLRSKIKPEGWVGPSHEGNHGRFTEVFE